MIKNDLLVFSQTRWGFIYQRSQQLLSRYAKYRRIFFIEEPLFAATNQMSYHKIFTENRIEVIKPLLPLGLTASQTTEALKQIVDDVIENEFIVNFSAWYDSPKAIDYTRHLLPINTTYDCISQSSPEKPDELSVQEIELLEKADLVFTANANLYSHRKSRHHNIHNFSSSIDLSHFYQARRLSEPLEQQKISGPKLGFYGDVTDQLHFDLLTDLADYRPSWNFILLGPMIGNCYNDLPRRPNIYFLGKKDYKYLPHYFAGWDIAIAPYKEGKYGYTTSQIYEYLAAGCPVVATPHEILAKEYEPLGFVKTAHTATCFLAACEEALKLKKDAIWLKKIDNYLENQSWDKTFEEMKSLEIKTLTSCLPYKKINFIIDSSMHI